MICVFRSVEPHWSDVCLMMFLMSVGFWSVGEINRKQFQTKIIFLLWCSPPQTKVAATTLHCVYSFIFILTLTVFISCFPLQETDSWEIIEGLRIGQTHIQRPEKHEGFMLKKRKWPLKGWHKVGNDYHQLVSTGQGCVSQKHRYPINGRMFHCYQHSSRIQCFLKL